jgi:hypothetical protein
VTQLVKEGVGVASLSVEEDASPSVSGVEGDGSKGSSGMALEEGVPSGGGVSSPAKEVGSGDGITGD